MSDDGGYTPNTDSVSALPGLYQDAFALVAVNELLLGLVDMTQHIMDVETEFRLGPFPAVLGLEQLLERDHLRMKRIPFA